MEIRLPFLGLLLIVCVEGGLGALNVYSARLVHRFSDEAKVHQDARVLKNGPAMGRGGGFWPQRRSLEYYRRLLSSDVQRQRLKLNPQFQFLYPSEGSATLPLGNDFGWLHYMWIDIGTPKVSFLVALDVGSDLFWVPCDCVKCAPLSSSYYSSLDRDLNEYNPSGSSTSNIISCSHQLCELSPDCPNPKQQCPYTVNYYTDDTSTSGYLVEDVLHLVPGNSDVSNKSVKAPVIIGYILIFFILQSSQGLPYTSIYPYLDAYMFYFSCGSKQTGGYLNGVAPDGLLGLGLGEISVASFLAKVGYIRNSFSLCFNEDDSGKLLFGDQGIVSQQTTPFLPLNGKNLTYIVGVDACCIESSCIDNMDFQMLVDSGSSFSYIPEQIFEEVADEFDRHVNASKSTFPGYPWKYCYESSSNGVPKLPSFTLKLATSKSFVVSNPVFVIYGTQGAVGFCLAVQPTDGDIGTIGQNFMTGYQIVFDRENFKLGWSQSNCKDLGYGDRVPLNPSGNNNSPDSLPTTEQQSAPNGHAVSPAVAGRTASKSSRTCMSCLLKLLLFLLMVHIY